MSKVWTEQELRDLAAINEENEKRALARVARREQIAEAARESVRDFKMATGH